MKRKALNKLKDQLEVAKAAIALAAIHMVEVEADHAFDKAAIKRPKRKK